MKDGISKLILECKGLRSKLIKGKIEIEQLGLYRDTVFKPLMGYFLDPNLEADAVTKGDYEDFLYLCLDYYSYTSDILISDYDYDRVMRCYMASGGNLISKADPLQLTTWNIVKHEEPGVVGTVSKAYTKEELEEFWKKYGYRYHYIIGPKYDGISASVKIRNNEIVRAWTRYDGVYGQDITEIVVNASNANSFYKHFDDLDNTSDGFYKVELCVGNELFEELIKEKEYANRRSATSGIVNSPKNVHLAKYVTIIPLAKYRDGKLMYYPLNCKYIDNAGSADYLYDQIFEVLNLCRDVNFEFRTDGAVIMACADDFDINDMMSNAIAYKVNTKEGYTKIKNLYVSVGRTGKACPKAEVYPVECNETRVHDVSLGSFDKMISMNLHENEDVIIFSAGDVIPQLKLPEVRHYPKNASTIYIDLRCPYCGKKLKSVGREMYCMNDDCVRKKTGRVTNFVQKIGMENISDSTIEDLFEAKKIQDIPDLFRLTYDDIISMEGYQELSAINIIDEINKIRNNYIPIDKLYGALGIPDVAEVTARKIFAVISLKDIDKAFVKKDWYKLFLKIQSAGGIGDKIANNFVKFIEENDDMIEDLLEILHVTEPPKYKGNVAFSGYRNADTEAKFRALGYDILNGINDSTVALITNSTDYKSTKCQKAIKKDIPIYQPYEIDDLLMKMRKGTL